MKPSLIESAKRLQPMVAVVDLSLTPGESLQLAEAAPVRCPELKLILFSVHDEPSVCRSAMAAGADGFVLKRAIATQLLDAVDESAGRPTLHAARVTGAFAAGGAERASEMNRSAMQIIHQ